MPKDNADTQPTIIAIRATSGDVSRLNMELAITNKVDQNGSSASATATASVAQTITGGGGGFIRPKRDPNDLEIL